MNKQVDMSRYVSREGEKFNYWLFSKFTGFKNGRAVGVFICCCGKEKESRIARIFSGDSKSCGCMKKELVSKSRTSHGESKSKLYSRWWSIVQRCEYEKNDSYSQYGARGIKMCSSWRQSFEEFRDWCHKNGYREDLQIDRIDTNGDYCPENCRFVTQTKNNRNRNVSKYWFVRGVRYDGLGDASIKLGVSKSTIRSWCEGRTDRYGFHKPKDDCWSELKYQDANAHGVPVVEVSNG